MSFLLTPNTEKVEKQGVECFYCKRVFCSPQALGGHLKAHPEEVKPKKSWNSPGQFSNSENGTNSTQSLIISQPENVSEGAVSHPYPLFSNVVCQFNTDQFQPFMDGIPSISENALPGFQNYNYDKLPYLVNAVTDDGRSPGQGEVNRAKKITGGKRRYSGEAQGSAGTLNELKRTKINSDEMETDNPQRTELLIFIEEHKSNSESGMPLFEEEETDLDLSLHL